MRVYLFRLLIAAVLVLVPASSSFASANCLQDANKVSAEVASGVQREIKPPSIEDTKAVLKTTSSEGPILDQGRRGFCWLYATFGNLIQRVLQRTGINPNLSIYYSSYFHWLQRATDAALDLSASTIHEGGSAAIALDNFRTNGVITAEEWQRIGGATDIQLPEKDAREMPQVASYCQRVHASKQVLTNWLKPDMPVGSPDLAFKAYYDILYKADVFLKPMRTLLDEKTNQIRTGKNTKFTMPMIQKMRKLLNQQLNPLKELNGNEIQTILDALDADIRSGMKILFNQMYFNKDTNPIETEIDQKAALNRAFETFPELGHGQFFLEITLDRKQKPAVTKVEGAEITIAVSIKDAERILGYLLKSNIPMVLVYDHQGSYVDPVDPKNPQDQGMMSVRRVKFAPDSAYVSRVERAIPSVHYVRGGHLVNVVGVYLKAEASSEAKENGDDVNGFLIHNSWGIGQGNNGHFRADTSYFGAFADGLNGFIPDLNKPEILKILGKEISDIVLKLSAPPKT